MPERVEASSDATADATPSTSPQPPAATDLPAATEPPAGPDLSATDGPLAGSPQQRIHRRLRRLLARSDVPGTVAMAVLDADGRPIFGHRAGRLLLPASTQKLPTAAAAIARLGGDFRFQTTVRTTVRPDADGVVHGDLVIVGGADPTLAGPDFARVAPDRPRAPLERLVRQIKQAGVRRVTGRILGDPTILAEEPIAAGWLDRYFDEFDATRISGLTVDQGRRLYRANGVVRSRQAEDPAREAARSLRALLRTRGVKVGGKARSVRSAPATTAELASIQSRPLQRLLEYTVQRSDNHIADTVFRVLGAADQDPTWVGAAGATAQALAPLQLDWDGVVLADGSGLSRANRMPPRFLADLQSRMWRSNVATQWQQLLAVTAHRGTLRYRLRSTVAAGRVYGKTGSLRDVSTLTGTVVGPIGRTVHFSIAGNDLTRVDLMRNLTDRALLIMAEELYECSREPVAKPRKARKAGKPTTQLVCAHP